MSTMGWKIFCEKSTIHSIPDIQNAHGYKWKVFWIVVLIACTGCASVEIYRVFHQFSQKPILTTYDYHSLSNISFPKVSVCLPHFINTSKVDEEKIAPSIVNQIIGASWGPIYLSMMMSAINDKFETPLGELAPLLIARDYSQALEIARKLAPVYKRKPETLVAAAANELSKLFPKIFLGNELFKAHFQQISKYLTPEGYLDNKKFLEVFSLQLNETLLMCYFNRIRKCDSIGKPVFDVKYQRCFLLEVNEPQAIGGFGLALVINTHSSTLAWPAIPSLEHGVVMTISDQYIPFSDSYLSAPAGTSAQVQLRPTHNILTKGKKYGTCKDHSHHALLTDKIPYSDFGCRGDCLFEKIMKACGCIMYFPEVYLQNGSSAKTCRSFDEMMCLTRVSANDPRCSAKCGPPCNNWQYSPTISYTKFPSPKLGQWLSEKGWDQNLDDMICLLVSFAEMTYTLISQEDSLTFDGFIGQIGGHLGLFLGGSIISIVQMLVYLLPPLFVSAQNKIFAKESFSKETMNMKNGEVDARQRAGSAF